MFFGYFTSSSIRKLKKVGGKSVPPASVVESSEINSLQTRIYAYMFPLVWKRVGLQYCNAIATFI